MGLCEVAHVSHLDAWSMPFRYACKLLAVAGERREGDEGPREKVEPVTTPGGQVLPPGMSKLARMLGMV